MTYTLRYHLYAILPLAFALSLLKLQQGNDDENELKNLGLPLVVLLPALSSVWPAHAITLLGRPPWLPLSSIDVCLLGCVAYTVLASLHFAVSALQIVSARFLKYYIFSISTTTVFSRSTAAQVFLYVAVIVSSAFHPAMPALLGVLVLLVTSCCYTTIAATTRMSPPPPSPSRKQSWLVTHILASVPAGIWLFGWIASGRSHSYPIFSLERVFMLIQGAHSCSIAVSLAPAASTPPTSFSDVLYEKMTAILAVFVVFFGLWGSLHVVIPIMAILSGWELIIRMVLRGKEIQRKGK
jgi:hypothetical protein